MNTANMEPPTLNPERRAGKMTKAILICPAERPEVSGLAETIPLVNLCVWGKPFIHHWLEHLAGCGAKEVRILAADRPEQVREMTGDGSRWGLRIDIVPQPHELTCAEARRKFSGMNMPSALSSNTIILIDHLPEFPGTKLFSSYADFFYVMQMGLTHNAARPRFGVKEIQPGVWVGLRAHISPRAKLNPPCWIGENALIKADAEIGPMTILENDVAIESGAAIQQSWIASQTFVGSLTQIKESLASGNVLVNFQTNSVVKIPDAFLLCALGDRNLPTRSTNLLGRTAALITILVTLPFALITLCRAKWSGHRALRARRAVAPQTFGENVPSIAYYEFTNANGWWKRWPQLWNVVQGEFAWIGNRPLTSIEAGKLETEFERLWLASPIGLISQGDAEGCTSLSSDEARAHASFYSASANWRLDFSIAFRAMNRLLGRKLSQPLPQESDGFKEPRIPLAANFR